MSQNAPAIDIGRAYEAVRAQAVGMVPTITPRELVLLLDAGLPTWINACPPLTPGPPPNVASEPRPALAGLSVELVSVLTEMALSNRRKCYP